jgi:hypothetical protein
MEKLRGWNAFRRVQESPRPPEVLKAGQCPVCGDDLVSEMHFEPERGFLMRVRCWASFGDEPSCSYRRVI